MRYTKEFKLNCVKKYKAGESISDPGGCKHKTFHKKVRTRTHIYDSLGEEGLEHKIRARTWKDKLEMILKVVSGKSISEVAISNGIEVSLLSKWYKIYQKNGIDGLKLVRRGRPPKMGNKTKIPNVEKTQNDLEKENEYLRAENEFLKKLNALVQKRMDRQSKKK